MPLLELLTESKRMINRNYINDIIRPPQCVWDALDSTGMTTMHHYFWDYPLFILCPLKYEKTVRGYRNLMASIMEK